MKSHCGAGLTQSHSHAGCDSETEAKSGAAIQCLALKMHLIKQSGCFFPPVYSVNVELAQEGIKLCQTVIPKRWWGREVII